MQQHQTKVLTLVGLGRTSDHQVQLDAKADSLRKAERDLGFLEKVNILLLCMLFPVRVHSFPCVYYCQHTSYSSSAMGFASVLQQSGNLKKVLTSYQSEFKTNGYAQTALHQNCQENWRPVLCFKHLAWYACC